MSGLVAKELVQESGNDDSCDHQDLVLDDVRESGELVDARPLCSVHDGSDNHYNNPEMEDRDEEVWDFTEAHVVLSSDSEHEVGNDDETSIADDLATWSNEHQIKQKAADDLLKLLRNHGHMDLPSSARTLLKTKRDVKTEFKSGMEYIYLGLKESLLKNLDKYGQEIKENMDTVDISLNIDGLPLFSSSKTSFWPVLCAILSEPITVFPVALTCGTSKPANLDFLTDTVSDLGNLIHHGLEFHGRTLQVKLKCIVCDAPARAMVKGTKLYAGYYGCERCTQKGVWLGRMTFQDVEIVEPRTNQSFRNQTQEEHHHIVSPFCNLQIDMIKTFSLDYMHQACLGVMKKLILIWMRGKKEHRISAGQISNINMKLFELRRFIPRCFARKPRGLGDIDRWKATELRQFLLYTGKYVLKGILRPDLYDHFMILTVAMCILVCPRLAQVHCQYAQELLTYFVSRGRELYGGEFMVYNVHAMLHIADDAKEFGTLDKCSAFPFENFNYKIKRLVRSGKRPLVQVVKRLHELENASCTKRHTTSRSISVHKPDNAYIIDDSSSCEVVALTNEKDEQQKKMLLCRVYVRAKAAFVEPCDSRIIGVYQVHTDTACMKLLPERSLERKAIMVEEDHGTQAMFFAILHQF